MRDGLRVATLTATEPSYESEGGSAVLRTKEQPLKRGQSYVLTPRSREGVTQAKRRKGREMRTSDTILGLLRERGSKGLPLERVYRLLYNPDLYLRAYGKIYRNHGAMTKGTTNETVDGMSLHKIETIIQALRDGTFQWQPVRWVYIPKKQGKMRPLGLPDWSSKLVQEVIRMILEAYYEPRFSSHAHGFRPGRGCHTALREIRTQWTGTVGFLEGDISRCF